MIYNLTPHNVNLHDGEKVFKVFEPSPEHLPVRIADIEMGKTTVDEFVVPMVGYGQLVNMPPQRHDTYYIVSLVVALAVRRSDFLVPYNEVRNGDGVILGCRHLAKVL